MNANYAQNLAVVEANADAARRQLVFTLAQGESQLATSWNASDPSYYPMNYPGLPDIRGKDMAEAFMKHLDSMGIEITEEKITADGILKVRVISK